MAKIPVGQTVASAYGFVFRDFLNVLRLTWVPIVAIVAVFALASGPYISAVMTMAATQDPTALLSAGPLVLLAFVVAFIAISMIMVALTRAALGEKVGGSFFYVPLDAAVWRVIGAYLLLMLLMIGIGIALIVIGVIGGFIVLALGTVGGVIGIIGAIALYCAFLYIVIRLSFLIVPSVVDQNRITLRRGWALTKGNFWRIVGVGLAIIVPVSVVGFILIGLVAGFSMFPAIAAAGPDAGPEAMAAVMAQAQGALLLVIPIYLAWSLLLYALLAAAPAFAYRSLVGPSGETLAETFQ